MKILCLFDYKANTGFSTVSTNILKFLKINLKDKVFFDIIAINYFGNDFYEDEYTFVTSAKLKDDKHDDYGRYLLLKTLKLSNEYDLLFIINDVGVILPISGLIKDLQDEKRINRKKTFKSLFYFPVDCKQFDLITDGFENFDYLITYTEWGRNEILNLKPKLAKKLSVIPHGINTNDFKILPEHEIKEFRSQYFGENANKIIFANINRNQPRKGIIDTIFAFEEATNALKDLGYKNQIFLYLHMHPKDPMGHDLRAVLAQTTLKEDIDFQLLQKEDEEKIIDTKTLNKIYNSIDAYITTTLGEGWGLTVTEAMAVKKPIICPNNTSLREITKNGENAYTYETFYKVCNTTDNIIRYSGDYKDISDLIIFVASQIDVKTINNRFERTEIKSSEMQLKIERNYEYVRQLSWKIICQNWENIFRKI